MSRLLSLRIWGLLAILLSLVGGNGWAGEADPGLDRSLFRQEIQLPESGRQDQTSSCPPASPYVWQIETVDPCVPPEFHDMRDRALALDALG